MSSGINKLSKTYFVQGKCMYNWNMDCGNLIIRLLIMIVNEVTVSIRFHCQSWLTIAHIGTETTFHHVLNICKFTPNKQTAYKSCLLDYPVFKIFTNPKNH